MVPVCEVDRLCRLICVRRDRSGPSTVTEGRDDYEHGYRTTIQADLIILGWSQRLEPGHAPTVRRTVTEATVPVMLIPVAS
ncbi:hypothetical protein CRH09_27220 [Nocardia terpenica]|uniref:Uncharacterized protein n=1 Tax=Nocardia terpenica TaxID=455432 RepID=A0A291RPV0_9NOCA|nr:hypothetical protein CRH09_27220 [Nocardia terpenica]